MYKNPELSNQAKALAAALGSFGYSLKHSQALEALARMEGARTLHVAQAKKKNGVRLDVAASAQAQALMFSSLGAYEGRFETLLSELKVLGLATNTSEAVAKVSELFYSENPVSLNTGYSVADAAFLFDQFTKLKNTLRSTLASLTDADSAMGDSLLFEGPLVDWAVEQDSKNLGPADDFRRVVYDTKVQKSGSQFYFDVAQRGVEDVDGMPAGTQMSLFIEINEGLPCIHMSNGLFTDQVLSVFFTKDGLYLRPDSSELAIRTGIPGEGLPELQAVHDRQRSPHQRFVATNHAFIPVDRIAD